MAKLTLDRLKELLDYDPSTGIFQWKQRLSPRVTVGDSAGAVSKSGRRYIALDGEKFMGHRLAWFYTHGEWPVGDLRQKDDNFDNCALDNLEVVSRSVASRGRALDARNQSGFRGVSKSRGRWVSFITRECKQVYLGAFDTPQEASAAYEAAARDLEATNSVGGKTEASEAAKHRRRLRVAWQKLETPNSWTSFADFVASVGAVPPRHSIKAIRDGEIVGPDNFQCVADLSTGFDLSTHEGRIAYGRAHRQNNQEHYRDKDLRKKFDIGIPEYNAMLASQNGVCAICSREEKAVRNDKTLALAVDHDHKTMKIRGILCGNCNKALGKFEDNQDLLRNAIVYLAKHQPIDPAQQRLDAYNEFVEAQYSSEPN